VNNATVPPITVISHATIKLMRMKRYVAEP
jgi:hypothetical protein